MRGREFIVAVDLDDSERDARILLAAPLSARICTTQFAAVTRATGGVERARAGGHRRAHTVKLDELVLEEKPLPQIPRGRRRRRCLRACAKLGIAALRGIARQRDL